MVEPYDVGQLWPQRGLGLSNFRNRITQDFNYFVSVFCNLSFALRVKTLTKLLKHDHSFGRERNIFSFYLEFLRIESHVEMF